MSPTQLTREPFFPQIKVSQWLVNVLPSIRLSSCALASVEAAGGFLKHQHSYCWLPKTWTLCQLSSQLRRWWSLALLLPAHFFRILLQTSILSTFMWSIPSQVQWVTQRSFYSDKMLIWVTERALCSDKIMASFVNRLTEGFMKGKVNAEQCLFTGGIVSAKISLCLGEWVTGSSRCLKYRRWPALAEENASTRVRVSGCGGRGVNPMTRMLWEVG